MSLKCAECGFTDPDVTFFYKGNLDDFYCSLHLPCEECGVVHYEDETEVVIL